MSNPKWKRGGKETPKEKPKAKNKQKRWDDLHS
jgi:hypothetical protein